MRQLILDFKTWRCGGLYNNIVGEGYTRLLNPQGYMCCLGQFALQCGFTADEITNQEQPQDLCKPFLRFNEKKFPELRIYKNTPLADTCIAINDDPGTTYLQKIDALRILLAQHEIELIVINTP